MIGEPNMRNTNIRLALSLAAIALAAVPHLAHASALGDLVNVLVRHIDGPH